MEAFAGIPDSMQMRIILFTMVISACAPSRPDKFMDDIEAAVEMPAGAHPISQYRRYYTENERVVAGTYIFDKKPGREWRTSKNSVITFHGGCNVVNVTYSKLDQKITFIECNDTGE
jgi:hypothetical protein